MTNKLTRYQQTGDFHFVSLSCYRHKAHLGSPDARSLFEQSLETVRNRYDLFAFGYVVMPEHVHLLVSEPTRALLSTAIQALKLSVAVQRQERPFWQARYYDFNVYTNAKHVEKLKYTHRSPVTRGLVSNLEDWPYSSYRHYQTGQRGTIEIESHGPPSIGNRHPKQHSTIRESHPSRTPRGKDGAPRELGSRQQVKRKGGAPGTGHPSTAIN